MAGDPRALDFLTRLARTEEGAATGTGTGPNGNGMADFRLGPRRATLLSHPDLVREVLVVQHRKVAKGRALETAKRLLGEGLLTSEGEHHKRQRRLVQPLFHHERVAGYAATMAEHAQRTAKSWSDGAVLDLNQEMMRLTLAIVGRALFSADVERDAADVGRALTATLESFNRFASPFAPLYEVLPLPSTLRFRRARATLDRIIHRMIEARRGGVEGHGDLLALLLHAPDLEGGPGGMTDEQVRDEAITIFLAGHETTAQLLTWTFYLLSQDPDAEGRLHAELDSTLGGRDPAPDDVPRLPYTRMVLAESMRLYPPAWVLGRRVVEPLELRGRTFEPGHILAMSQWVTHRDARWWSEPSRFDPARFSPEAIAGRDKYAYFPFGGGPRVCIGEGFAWTEGTILLATLAQRWKLRLVEGHRVVPQPLITLRPRHGMSMRIEARSPGR
jgi:cytochrome P450